jgi:hypothetical protein
MECAIFLKMISFLIIQIAQHIVTMISMKNGRLSWSLMLSNMIEMSLVLGKKTFRLNQQAEAKGQ